MKTFSDQGDEYHMAYRVVEMINAHGHRAVKATHRTTFEITKEEHLTSRGDCILAVGADKGISELSATFRRLVSRETAAISITIEVGGLIETAVGRGSRLLTFEDKNDIVARKSTFTCGRTVMIRSNKAAADFSREIAKRLRDPDAPVKVTLVAVLSDPYVDGKLKFSRRDSLDVSCDVDRYHFST